MVAERFLRQHHAATCSTNQGGYRLDFPIVITRSGRAATIRRRATPRTGTSTTRSTGSRARTASRSGGSFEQVTHNQNGWNAVPTLTFGVDTEHRSGERDVQHDELPRRVDRAADRGAELYAHPDRPRHADHRDRAARRRHRQVRLPRRLSSVRAVESSAFFAQDSWRVTPALTVNYGLRWDLQHAVHAADQHLVARDARGHLRRLRRRRRPDGRECNLFQPGNLAGGQRIRRATTAFEPGIPAYKTNWNNFAPNVGVAWRPNVQGGLLRALLGDPEQATMRGRLRGRATTVSASTASPRLVGDNPGGTVSGDAQLHDRLSSCSPATSCAGALRERAASAAGVPAIAGLSDSAPTLEQRATSSTPASEDAGVHSFSVGFQRSLGSDMALEVRYVGNRNRNTWATENWNERALFENRFLDEFKLAQANLAAHVAQGCAATATCSFAYRGPGHRHVAAADPPGVPAGPVASRATEAAAYIERELPQLARSPAASATTSRTSPARPTTLHSEPDLPRQRDRRGTAAEPLRDEPGDRAARTSRGRRERHEVQLAADRAAPPLSQGLLVSGNYTYASRRRPRTSLPLRRDRVYLANSSTQQDIPHSFKMTLGCTRCRSAAAAASARTCTRS